MTKRNSSFGEKGVILQSAAARNLKLILAIWEEAGGEHKPLVKVTFRHDHKSSGIPKTNKMYKTWINVTELHALILSLQRAATLLDEWAEGTLDLEDILAEDEDARILVSTERILAPTIEGMLSMKNRIREEAEEEQNSPSDIDINDWSKDDL